MRGRTWVECPGDCEEGEIKILFRVHQGEPAVRKPNSRAHPGSPDCAEIVSELDRLNCECGPLSKEEWDRLERDRQEQMLDNYDPWR